MIEIDDIDIDLDAPHPNWIEQVSPMSNETAKETTNKWLRSVANPSLQPFQLIAWSFQLLTIRIVNDLRTRPFEVFYRTSGYSTKFDECQEIVYASVRTHLDHFRVAEYRKANNQEIPIENYTPFISRTEAENNAEYLNDDRSSLFYAVVEVKVGGKHE